MKKGLNYLLLIALLFSITLISSAAIEDDMHLNIQVRDSSGNIQTGTFKFGFNISTTNGCTNVDNIVFANATTQATDVRGIVSYYLENVNLNFTDQYWLCYYRDGTLQSTSQLARVPYSFNSKYLNGYESSAFFPFNTSVTGTFDFNGGWQSADHTHTSAAHIHDVTGSTSTESIHTHAVDVVNVSSQKPSDGGSTALTNAPYVQYLVCIRQ
ncbi:hypothetical protein HYT25_02850 [Candidatus Pacearchaeota archaeon]|nr:hypothetical protein [Candidatus Pacearchaeota archaeon]